VAELYTIRVFVPYGNPQGVEIVELDGGRDGGRWQKEQLTASLLYWGRESVPR